MKWLRVHADGAGLTLAKLTRFDRASTGYLRVFPGAAFGPRNVYATITRVDGLSRAGTQDVEALFARQYGNCRTVQVGDETHFHVAMPAATLWAPIMQELTTTRALVRDILVRMKDGMIDLFALGDDAEIERLAATFRHAPGEISIVDEVDTTPWLSIQAPETVA